MRLIIMKKSTMTAILVIIIVLVVFAVGYILGTTQTKLSDSGKSTSSVISQSQTQTDETQNKVQVAEWTYKKVSDGYYSNDMFKVSILSYEYIYDNITKRLAVNFLWEVSKKTNGLWTIVPVSKNDGKWNFLEYKNGNVNGEISGGVTDKSWALFDIEGVKKIKIQLCENSSNIIRDKNNIATGCRSILAQDEIEIIKK